MDKEKIGFELRKPFTISGRWWLPEHSDNKVPGDIIYNPRDGLLLKLLDVLSEDAGEEQRVEDIILGLSTEAKGITLRNCLCTSTGRSYSFQEFGPSAFATQNFRVEMLLFGTHISSKDDFVFSQLNVDYPLLFEWLGAKPFDVNIEGRWERAIITFDKSEQFSVDLGNGFSISVPPGGTWRHNGLREFVAEEHYQLVIRSANNRNLDDFLKINSVFQSFLSLATGVPVYPKGLTFYIKLSEDRPMKQVDVFYDLPRWAGVMREVSFHEMLFTRRHLGDDIEGIIKAWFKLESDLKMVHGALFGNVFNPNLYPENEFLNLVQGLESYHRIRMSNQIEPEDVYIMRKQRIKAALVSLPTDDWVWVARKLDHANEPSLVTRLTDILFAFKDCLPFLDDDRINWLIESVVDARNRMMHPEEGRPFKLTVIQLISINLVLKMLTESILLFESEIGISRIPDMLKRTWDYRTAVFLSEKHVFIGES